MISAGKKFATIACLVPLLLSTLVAVFPAYAEEKSTVQNLYVQCKAKTSVDTIECVRFLQGAFSTMRIAGEWATDKVTPADAREGLLTVGICTTTPVSGAQLVQAFSNWAEQHPAYWQYDASYGVLFAFKSEWRCADKSFAGKPKD